jgi:SNF2 family DNA or RNA helicase
MVTPAVKYIKELLDEVDKVLVFTHHIDVSKNMKKALKAFNPVMVIGETKDKQGAVDTFQLDHSCRVLIGSTAAGVGFNMTAASEVVLMEPSYVPSMNEQQIDRAHRIGQKCKVNIHYLVIEGTLGSKILSKSLSKQRDLDKILDGV